VTSDLCLKLSINFVCLPRETGKARALEIDLRRVEANLSTDEEENHQIDTYKRRYYTEIQNNVQ